MSVPDFQTLMLPMLEILGDGQVRHVVPDLTDALAARMALTQDDVEQLLPSGTQTAFENRTRWAAHYLVRAGVLNSPKRGYVTIAPRGVDLLASKPGKVNIAILSQYPEFEEFRKRKATPGSPGPTAAGAPKAEEQNPEEALYLAYASWRQTIEGELLERLQSESFPWQTFEHLVVDLLHAMGYGGSDPTGLRVTKMTGDEGIDGVIDEDTLGLDAVYIQAKNYGPGHKVGRPDLQKFAGSLEGARATKGVFITTSSFSEEARQFVEKISRRIVLIDGKVLARHMYDHGVGVRTRRSLDVNNIDDAYFEGDA